MTEIVLKQGSQVYLTSSFLDTTTQSHVLQAADTDNTLKCSNLPQFFFFGDCLEHKKLLEPCSFEINKK